jgi:hypothetical protein
MASIMVVEVGIVRRGAPRSPMGTSPSTSTMAPSFRHDPDDTPCMSTALTLRSVVRPHRRAHAWRSNRSQVLIGGMLASHAHGRDIPSRAS